MSSMFKVKSYISIVNIVCHQLLLLLSAVKNVTILLFKEEKLLINKRYIFLFHLNKSIAIMYYFYFIFIIEM